MAPLAGLLTATMVLAGCGAGGDRESDAGDGGGGASDVGVTDDTITLGAHFPLTGVAAPGYSEIPTGAKAYFDYVNAAGGVNGRQIEYIVKDDGYNPTNTSQVTNELVLKDEIFAMVGGLGTPTHSAVVDFLNSEGVPGLLRLLGLAAVGRRRRGQALHVRLAARLRDRGQDHRPVRRREHARREGRPLPPGRRLRRRRREGRAPVPRRPDRGRGALHLRQHRRRPPGRRVSRPPAPTWCSPSTPRPTPR